MSCHSSKAKPAALIHPLSSPDIERSLVLRGFTVYRIPPSGCVDPRLSGHPDLQIFSVPGHVFTHPDIDNVCAGHCARHAEVIRCTTRLGPDYPEDCPYNIAFTGKYALCRESIIPDEIRAFFKADGIQLIDIPQGYAKCSILVIDENSIITEDAGIRTRAEQNGLDVLTIRKGQIPLTGFPHGFIGGAGGLHGNSVYLTGKITQHPDYADIVSFIRMRGKEIVICSPHPAEDMGSILFL